MMRKRILQLTLSLFLFGSVWAQLPWYIHSLEVVPPGTSGLGSVTVSGVWPDTCAPNAISHSNSGTNVNLSVAYPGLNVGCGDLPTPWALTEEFTANPEHFSLYSSLYAVDPADPGLRILEDGPDLLYEVRPPSALLEGLGNPIQGYVSRAFDVSSNGKVVVGHNELAPGGAAFIIKQAMYWTSGAGQVPLDFLPGGIPGESSAFGVSPGGAYIAGVSTTSSQFGLPEAVRWSRAGETLGLGGLEEVSLSQGVAVSWRGQYVAGTDLFYPPGPPGVIERAVRWSADSGMVDLGTLSGDGRSFATDMSRHGSVVVGGVSSIPHISNPLVREGFSVEPFVWTTHQGMVGLGHLPYEPADVPNAFLETVPHAVSANGQFVVGTSRLVSLDGQPDLMHRAFMWTEQTGMLDLGDLPILVCCAEYDAVDVSANGDFVVGNLTINGITQTREPFLWTPDQGMRLLVSVLAENGLSDLGGWQLGTVTAISDNGAAIVGNGINPDGVDEAWRILFTRTNSNPLNTRRWDFQFSAVPEPSGLAILATALILAGGGQRQRRGRFPI